MRMRVRMRMTEDDDCTIPKSITIQRRHDMPRQMGGGFRSALRNTFPNRTRVNRPVTTTNPKNNTLDRPATARETIIDIDDTYEMFA